MTSKFPTDRKPKRKALLEAVEGVRDVVEASALEAEELRTLPRKAVDAIYDAGLFSLKVPEVLGGAEADLVTQIEVVEAMTRIDTSAGWTMMIGAGSLGLASAFLSEEAVPEVFADGRIPRFASSSRPSGTAVPAEGGFIVNGRWPFASGVLHSEWILAGVPALDGAAPGTRRTVIFPTSKAEIHDNWHVAGLQGTGSCDFSLEDVFVPEEFTFEVMNDTPRRGLPLFNIRVPGILAVEHVGSPWARDVVRWTRLLSSPRPRAEASRHPRSYSGPRFSRLSASVTSGFGPHVPSPWRSTKTPGRRCAPASRSA